MVGPTLKRAREDDEVEFELMAKPQAWRLLRTAESLAPGAISRARAGTPPRLVGLVAPGGEIDTAGVLLAAGRPDPIGRDQVLRQLFVADTAGSVIGVRWVLGATDPPPRIKVGDLISLRNLVLEHHSRFEVPPGAEHLAMGGALLMCLCGADALGPRAAVVRPHAAEHAPHLRPLLDALAAALRDPQTHRRLAELASLAAAVHGGRLRQQSADPLAAQWPALPPPPAAQPRCDYGALRSHLETQLGRGGATLAALAAASVCLGANEEAVQKMLDAMRDDMACYVIPTTGEYRLM